MSSFKSLLFVTLASTLVLGCKPKNPNLYGVTPPVTPPVAKDDLYNGPTHIPAEVPQQPTIPEGVKATLPEPVAPLAPKRFLQVDTEIFKPKLDVIVLMDPSDSMKDDQDKVKENISNFSKNFARKKEFLDLHMASVSAWDSISFKGQEESKNCVLGQLRPLGGNSMKPFKGNCKEASAQNAIPYITSETDLKLWGPTLAFGVEKFIREPDTKDASGNKIRGKVAHNSGPQHEEIFSPIIAALLPESQEMNKNFRRPDAHLAVIFFTDTDDFNYLTIEEDAQHQDELNKAGLLEVAAGLDLATRNKLEVTASDIAGFLNSQKKENASVSVYAALGRYDQYVTARNTEKYEFADYYIQQPGRGPKKMVELLELTKGKGFDLRGKNYGQELANIGNDIVAKSMRRTIVLEHTPDIGDPVGNPIVVKYGSNQIIPKSKTNGWILEIAEDSSGKVVHKIVISEGVQLKLEAGARFSVEYGIKR